MAFAKVDVFNAAIAGAVGIETAISDPNEASREAELCRQFFPIVVDLVLAAAPWSAAKKYRRMALLSTRDSNAEWFDGDPEPDYAYAYQEPSDLVRPMWLNTYERFTRGVVSGQKAIMTNAASALLFYTYRADNPGAWNVELFDAVAKGLGAAIVMPLTGKRQRMVDQINLANDAILRARASLANENFEHFETVPPWLAARGASGPGYPDRYVYPVGPLLTGSFA